MEQPLYRLLCLGEDRIPRALRQFDAEYGRP